FLHKTIDSEHRLILEIKKPFKMVESPFNKFKEDKIRVMLYRKHRNCYYFKGKFTAGQPRVVKCYNCQREGHMARQCTQPKRPRNAAWFKENLMLAKAQEAGQTLDEEQLAFLGDPGILEAPVAQQTIP
nr:zf-CCHC domain-containing protein/RVP_2 domain-containing protein [Tanacetum cinerariifolium]